MLGITHSLLPTGDSVGNPSDSLDTSKRFSATQRPAAAFRSLSGGNGRAVEWLGRYCGRVDHGRDLGVERLLSGCGGDYVIAEGGLGLRHRGREPSRFAPHECGTSTPWTMILYGSADRLVALCGGKGCSLDGSADYRSQKQTYYEHIPTLAAAKTASRIRSHAALYRN